MALEKNRPALWFRTDAPSVILVTPDEKRGDVLYGLAATLHLLGDEDR